MPPVPLLLPTPLRCRVWGEPGGMPAGLRAWLEAGIAQVGSPEHRQGMPMGVVLEDGGAGDEGYGLEVRPSSYVLRARTDRARRHAFATLLQLLDFYEDRLPCVSIDDTPAFATRGVMLDVSRDKVPTMDELRRTVDLLARLKFSHLQLYTEHTFAYAGHERVWRDASPITPAEAQSLDNYCAARGIELAANQNCFGHLSGWLKHPEYRHLAEIVGDDDEWAFAIWTKKGPFSLSPVVPESAAFVADLLGQLTPNFRSPLVNIGCDETFDVGHGRSKEAVAARGGGDSARVGLYFEFVNSIAETVRTLGKRPMMWADIALSHPEKIDRMPAEAIGLAWWYEPTEKFAEWCQVLREAGHEAWVCPGTSSWRSFTGRTRERRGNIADAATQGRASGATGLMVCDWGDVGHRQHWPIALAGIAHAAEAAWNPAGAGNFDPRAASLHVFGRKVDPEGTLGAWLDELGNADAELRQRAMLMNATCLFNDLHEPLNVQRRGMDDSIEHWEEARAGFEAIRARRPTIADALVEAEIQHTLDRVDLAFRHALLARRSAGPGLDRSTLAELAEWVLRRHRELWGKRNRPGGLASSSRHDEKILAGIRGEQVA